MTSTPDTKQTTRAHAVKTLNLNYNKLSVIPPGLFEKMHHVDNLYLGFNQIESLEPGALSGLHSMQFLYLQYNRFKELTDDMFQGANDNDNLVGINLEGNQISNLAKGCLNGMRGIKGLYLAGNEIEVVRADYFAGLVDLESEEGQLTFLELRNNRIENIMDASFIGLFDSNDGTLLDLGGNRLSQIRTHAFKHLKQGRLYLDDNELTYVGDGVFAPSFTFSSQTNYLVVYLNNNPGLEIEGPYVQGGRGGSEAGQGRGGGKRDSVPKRAQGRAGSSGAPRPPPSKKSPFFWAAKRAQNELAAATHQRPPSLGLLRSHAARQRPPSFVRASAKKSWR